MVRVFSSLARSRGPFCSLWSLGSSALSTAKVAEFLCPRCVAARAGCCEVPLPSAPSSAPKARHVNSRGDRREPTDRSPPSSPALEGPHDARRSFGPSRAGPLFGAVIRGFPSVTHGYSRGVPSGRGEGGGLAGPRAPTTPPRNAGHGRLAGETPPLGCGQRPRCVHFVHRAPPQPGVSPPRPMLLISPSGRYRAQRIGEPA